MYEVLDAERSRLLYLSQVDAQLVPYMGSKKSFVSDLITRLLLESGVVITDVYFFNSSEVTEDLQQRDLSWVWHGLKRGMIVPAFRETYVHSFTENGERSGMWKNMGVLSGSRDTAVKLDAAVADAQTPRITWPERMGVSYGELITQQFGRDSVEFNTWEGKQSRLWRQTAELRRKYLELGWQRVAEPDVHGLRRADIYTVIARDVGYQGDPADTAKIIECADRGMREPLRATFLWIDELYHFNQARRFTAKASFPVSRGPGALMIPGLLLGDQGAQAEPSDTWEYSHVIRWPSNAALRRTPPDRLLGLRSDAIGADYEKRLYRFRDHPADVTWEAFKVSADAYARKVCEAVGSEVTTGLEIKHILTRQRISLAAVLAGLGGSIATHESGSLAAYVASLVTTAVGALYIPVNEFIRTRTATSQVPLPMSGSKAGNVRIDLPTVK
jgi:hypothetical protein